MMMKRGVVCVSVRRAEKLRMALELAFRKAATRGDKRVLKCQPLYIAADHCCLRRQFNVNMITNMI